MSHAYFFVLLSTIAAFIRYGTYCLSVYRKQTRPHFFSWLMWGLMVGIGAFAQLKLGGGPSTWGLVIVSTTCLAISVWAFFVGEKNITRSDWIALVSAFATMALWGLTQNPMIAIILLVTFDVFSYWPTVRKCWNDPWSEPPGSMFWAGLRYFFLLFAVPDPSFSTEFYPFWLMASDWAFMLYVMIRRRILTRKTVSI